MCSTHLWPLTQNSFLPCSISLLATIRLLICSACVHACQPGITCKPTAAAEAEININFALNPCLLQYYSVLGFLVSVCLGSVCKLPNGCCMWGNLFLVGFLFGFGQAWVVTGCFGFMMMIMRGLGWWDGRADRLSGEPCKGNWSFFLSCFSCEGLSFCSSDSWVRWWKLGH
jgi:hypothetical protein